MLKPLLKAAWRHLPLKLPLLKVLRAVWRPPERIYRHLHFEGIFTVEPAPGAQFRLMSYGNAVENELFWAGYARSWERQSLGLWRELCREAGTVLDVGANTGVYALAAAALRPGAQVVAFEPVPRVCERLRRNAALNGGRVAVENVAVSDRDGTALLRDTDDAHVYSASLDREMLGSRYTRAYEVPTVTLDSYCAARGLERVDLVKIDVERHEAHVLRGFRRVLASARPVLLIEILGGEIGQAVAEELRGLDYRAYEIRERGTEQGLVPVTVLGLAERNYLVCQPDLAARLGLPEAPPLA